jgi:hypothetical protein
MALLIFRIKIVVAGLSEIAIVFSVTLLNRPGAIQGVYMVKIAQHDSGVERLQPLCSLQLTTGN